VTVTSYSYSHCGVRWARESLSKDECPNCLKMISPVSSEILDEGGPIVVLHSDMLVMAPYEGALITSAVHITQNGLDNLATIGETNTGIHIDQNKSRTFDSFAVAFNSFATERQYTERAGYVVAEVRNDGTIHFMSGNKAILFNKESEAKSVYTDLKGSGLVKDKYDVWLVVYRESDHRIHFVEGSYIVRHEVKRKL